MESIKLLELDCEKTIEVFNLSRGLYQPGMCYNNTVMAMVLLFDSEFISGVYRIGYGYVGGEGELFSRHCYIITEKDKVIDPGLLLKYKPDRLQIEAKERKVSYLTFADLKEKNFIAKLYKENNDPGLKNSLYSEEYECYRYMKRNNIRINSQDFGKYLKRFENVI